MSHPDTSMSDSQLAEVVHSCAIPVRSCKNSLNIDIIVLIVGVLDSILGLSIVRKVRLFHSMLIPLL